jgi:hypothetical protein
MVIRGSSEGHQRASEGNQRFIRRNQTSSGVIRAPHLSDEDVIIWSSEVHQAQSDVIRAPHLSDEDVADSERRASSVHAL